MIRALFRCSPWIGYVEPTPQGSFIHVRWTYRLSLRRDLAVWVGGQEVAADSSSPSFILLLTPPSSTSITTATSSSSFIFQPQAPQSPRPAPRLGIGSHRLSPRTRFPAMSRRQGVRISGHGYPTEPCIHHSAFGQPNHARFGRQLGRYQRCEIPTLLVPF